MPAEPATWDHDARMNRDIDDDATRTDATDASPRRRRRWLWAIGALVAIVAIVYGAILIYAKVINDSPDELDTGDLAAALSTGPTATGADTGAAPAPVSGSGGSDGTWDVTGDSELGYRVKENLFGVDAEAVGRTDRITGSLTIDGTTVTAADFEVDVASIESDDGRRDGQFRGSVMSTDEFPTATFSLTQPIELGVEPGDGAQVIATAGGDLTLRGVTNPVTFEVTAQQDGGRIGVLGNIPVTFADYGIANPSRPGISTEDHGLLEFVLVFEPAG